MQFSDLLEKYGYLYTVEKFRAQHSLGAIHDVVVVHKPDENGKLKILGSFSTRADENPIEWKSMYDLETIMHRSPSKFEGHPEHVVDAIEEFKKNYDNGNRIQGTKIGWLIDVEIFERSWR